MSAPRWITVVSGLPRSGTSLMMSMLHIGGLSALTDDSRPADEDNPRGYFELEAVKSLPEGAGWLEQAAGRAVKVQAYLLPALPEGFDYRIVFMERDPREITASQQRMLARQRPNAAGVDRVSFDLTGRHLAEAERWLTSRPALRSMRVDYRRLVAAPLADAHRVNAFLGGALDVTAMLGVVDPSLYRERATPSPWSRPVGGG